MQNAFKLVFLIGVIATEVIRAPHRARNRRARRRGEIAASRISPLEVGLMIAAWAGAQVIPLLYLFTDLFRFADYPLPVWIGFIGTGLFAVSLWVLWRAHADLGRSWSPSLEITEGQTLVTNGVYQHVRHPIYAAFWLAVIAQALLLPNWVAGFAGVVTFLPIYLFRVPREEQLMLDHFGAAYRDYMRHTKRILPGVL